MSGPLRVTQDSADLERMSGVWSLVFFVGGTIIIGVGIGALRHNGSVPKKVVGPSTRARIAGVGLIGVGALVAAYGVFGILIMGVL